MGRERGREKSGECVCVWRGEGGRKEGEELGGIRGDVVRGIAQEEGIAKR